MHSVAFSNDSSMMATGSSAGRARLWPVEDVAAPIVDVSDVAPTGVAWLAFSPDDQSFLTGSTYYYVQDNIQIWDAANGKSITSFCPPGVGSAAFSPDGSAIVTGSWDQTAVIWDLETEAPLSVLEGHFAPVLAVTFSPNGNRVATGGADHRVRIWSPETGENVRTLIGHTDAVYTVAFAGDTSRLLTAAWDSTAKVWDINSGNVVRTFSRDSQLLYAVGVVPNGQRAAMVDLLPGSAEIWDITNGKRVLALSGFAGGGVEAVAISPNNARVAAGYWGGDGSALILWDARSGDSLSSTRFTNVPYPYGFSPAVTSVDYSEDGRRLLVGRDDSSLVLVDASDLGIIRTFSPAQTGGAAALSPNGDTLVSAAGDEAILWNVATGDPVRFLTGHSSSITSTAFSPDGSKVLTGSTDQTAMLWDAATGSALTTLHCEYPVEGVRFSPEGSRAITCGGDGSRGEVTLWDLSSEQIVRVFVGHTSTVHDVAFSADGGTIVSGSEDSTAILWNAASGQGVHILSVNVSPITSVGFSSDSDFVVTGSWDGTVRKWCVDSLPGENAPTATPTATDTATARPTPTLTPGGIAFATPTPTAALAGCPCAADIWSEAWSRAQRRTYTPQGQLTFIQADEGRWFVGDTVSTECPRDSVSTSAEIVTSALGSALRLVSSNSDSDCTDNIWVDFMSSMRVPVDTNTYLCFEESGFLEPVDGKRKTRRSAVERRAEAHTGWADQEGALGARMPNVTSPCVECAISLALWDNRGNMVYYALQEDPGFEPIEDDPLFGDLVRDSYRTIRLGEEGGLFARNLYDDFSALANFEPEGAQIAHIAFTLPGPGEATLHYVTICEGTGP